MRTQIGVCCDQWMHSRPPPTQRRAIKLVFTRIWSISTTLIRAKDAANNGRLIDRQTRQVRRGGVTDWLMGLLQVGLRAPFTGISKKEGRTYLHRLRDSRNLGLPFPFNKIDLHTGLFIASGYFDTPLNSWQDVPILMPFEWVNKHTGRFVLRYNDAWYMARWLQDRSGKDKT